MANRKERVPDILHCPECRTPFEIPDAARYQQDGFPVVLYCASDCLLDARERRSGRDPRLRWPRLKTRMWRGREIHG